MVLVKDVANYDILYGKRGLIVVNTVSERLVETVVLYGKIIIGFQRSQRIVENGNLTFCDSKIYACCFIIVRIVGIGKRFEHYVVIACVYSRVIVGQGAVGIVVLKSCVDCVARYDTRAESRGIKDCFAVILIVSGKVCGSVERNAEILSYNVLINSGLPRSSTGSCARAVRRISVVVFSVSNVSVGGIEDVDCALGLIVVNKVFVFAHVLRIVERIEVHIVNFLCYPVLTCFGRVVINSLAYGMCSIVVYVDIGNNNSRAVVLFVGKSVILAFGSSGYVITESELVIYDFTELVFDFRRRRMSSFDSGIGNFVFTCLFFRGNLVVEVGDITAGIVGGIEVYFHLPENSAGVILKVSIVNRKNVCSLEVAGESKISVGCLCSSVNVIILPR